VIIYDLNAKPASPMGTMTGGTPMTGGGPMTGGRPPMSTPPMPPRPGSMMGSTPPMPGMGEADTDEIDDSPSLIVGVIDATLVRRTDLPNFNRGAPALFRHSYTLKPGGRVQLYAKQNEYEALHIPAKTPAALYAEAKNKLYKDTAKPDADQLVG